MSENEGAVEWGLELVPAAILGGAAGWSAAQVGGAVAAGIAAAAGVLLSLAAFSLFGRGRDHFRLPSFTVPSFPEPEPAELLLTEALPETVVPLRPLPTPGELDRRIRSHLQKREHSAEVVALEADASAALRDALAKLRRTAR